MPSIVERLRALRQHRVLNPSDTDLRSLAAEIEFRAHRIEAHAKELWDVRQQLNRHLAASAPGSHREACLVEAMRHLPSVAGLVSLGEAARALRDSATEVALGEQISVARPSAKDPGAVLEAAFSEQHGGMRVAS